MPSSGITAAALTARKAWRLARTEGPGQLGRRVVTTAVARVGAPAAELPLAAEDIADSTALPAWSNSSDGRRGQGLDIGWVCTPPGAGSGGHTTMFRYVQALETAGHRCVLYLYDRHGGDLALAEHTVRTWWPQVRAEVRDVRDGLRGLDAVAATSWQTAHVVARRGPRRGRRFYLVQDFEPFFYGRGAEYVLAEDSYRFGFHCLTVGPVLADVLKTEYGATADGLEFGCDRSVYRVQESAPRRDIVFYGRPEAPRRGFGLGVLAIELFLRGRPDVRVHTFGVKAPLPFPAERHAHLSPQALNELYNTCAAGLALSFTNVSLIPYELLAAGVVPVVNDDRYSRAVLDHPDVVWARATPQALADGLAEAVDGGTAPTDVADALGDLSWQRSTDTLVRLVEKSCYPSV